jgi:hypothetical protein
MVTRRKLATLCFAIAAYTKLHSNVSLSLSLTSASSETLWFVKFYIRLQLSISGVFDLLTCLPQLACQLQVQ